MTEEHICNILVPLSDLHHEYHSLLEDSQDELRGYVTNTNFSIDDRFDVWVNWCDKDHRNHLINEDDVPLFGKIVEDLYSYFYHHEEYDWLYFLELFDGNTERAALMRDKFCVTVDDVKEMLIKTNFKGYTHV